jgi:hypothetical protein
MAHQPQDETEQPPPPPSTETQPTPTTTSDMYLSTHLIVPYFITVGGEIKRPEHLIAWWSRIFSFYVPDEIDCIRLRFLCRLFRDALKPPPKGMFTTFPHLNHASLGSLVVRCHALYVKDPKRAPTVVFIASGTFSNSRTVTIKYPMRLIGAGQNKTFISGCEICVEGTNEKGKIVALKDFTSNRSSGCGVYNNNGLSFLCERMTFTQCRKSGVWVQNTKGRFINCVITQCRCSGICSGMNALIELEGSQTKVDGNVTREDGGGYGLRTFNSSSKIHLLSPLTKESVSTNNCYGLNYNRSGTILTVAVFSD